MHLIVFFVFVSRFKLGLKQKVGYIQFSGGINFARSFQCFAAVME